MTTLVAIDPGASGGIAWQQDGEKACCIAMPQTEGDLITFLRERDAQPTFYLENLVKHMGGGIPGSAMAVYASNWGFLKGAIQRGGDPLHLVAPAKWQTALSLGNSKRHKNKGAWKNHLKAEAQRLYPHLAVTLKTADALLILAYAKQQTN